MITLHAEDLLDWIEEQRRGQVDLRTDCVLRMLSAAVSDRELILAYEGEVDQLMHDLHVARRDANIAEAKTDEIRERCAAIGVNPFSHLPPGFMP